MKKTVFFRSAIRQPIRSLFIFLLAGVISFAFISRVGEVLLINQEMNELIQYYRSIGNLSMSSPDRYGNSWTEVPASLIEYLEESPYMAYVDQRQYTSGVIQNGLYNGNTFERYSSSILYADAAPEVNPADVFFYGTYAAGIGGGRYEFIVDEVLSGYPEYVTPGKSIYLSADQKAFGDAYTQLKRGERYLLRGCNGNRYSKVPQELTWKPLASDLPWFLPAESALDLSQPEYARFVSEMKQSHDNACALQVTATADMTTIPRFQPGAVDLNGERYYLAEGRWLNYEDHLAGNRVIVIYGGLANARGLKIGDSITVKLRDIAYAGPTDHTAQSYGYQHNIQPIGHEEAKRTQTETFEIVGIYEDSTRGTDGLQVPVYIPLSVFPEDFALAVPDDDPEICSLVLKSPANEEAFRAETEQHLKRMGYQITFVENNYQNFKNSADGIDTAARSNVTIFAVILAVCYCLACFVYFRFRRKDLAISRALGVPAGKCIAASVLPLILVGGVGIITGSALAWNYTQSNAETLLAALVEAASAEGASATLPMSTLAILIVSLIAALLVLAFIFATVTVKKPVLSQLQGGGNKR